MLDHVINYCDIEFHICRPSFGRLQRWCWYARKSPSSGRNMEWAEAKRIHCISQTNCTAKVKDFWLWN